MKILFLTTAHNSLSQRLSTLLSSPEYGHDVTIEYALSVTQMMEAVVLAEPRLIICPFLTARVPKEIYEKYITLIVHPGPPGDTGPSALDWTLLGDDGTEENASKALVSISSGEPPSPGRSHWGVTVLQAEEKLDGGPVWAFEQFALNIDDQELTKSKLYRGPVTKAAVTAVTAAIKRVESCASNATIDRHGVLPVQLPCPPEYRTKSVTSGEPFLGGRTHDRPLLKADHCSINFSKHSAAQISRRIRCSDSQPGFLSTIFGPKLYLYGGIVEDYHSFQGAATAGKIIGFREEAICLATCDNKGIWITHIRRPKAKTDPSLHPKLPATTGLLDLSAISSEEVTRRQLPLLDGEYVKASKSTFQEIHIDFQDDEKSACLHFNFYNGAMHTRQCTSMIKAIKFIMNKHLFEKPELDTVILMGGDYFSNGIHLNTIEAAPDPPTEAWININRIDDVAHYLLYTLPQYGIQSVAAIRGNCAAGGVALAAACDKVVALPGIVLNPAYRALGLSGSEYHSISYKGRCGAEVATTLLRDMLPISAATAREIDLVDGVLAEGSDGTDTEILEFVRSQWSDKSKTPSWKEDQELNLYNITQARITELHEMSLDFSSPRSRRFHTRRSDFVRKVKPKVTPLRFAEHRRNVDGHLDEEERDDFDSVPKYTTEENVLNTSAAALNSMEKLKYQGRAGAQSELTFPCIYEPGRSDL